MRMRLLVLVAIASLAAALPAVAADRALERGIVQSVDPAGVVLRALDGTEITVALVAETRYRLNGRPATIADLRPGFVAEVVMSAPGAAIVVRAFGVVERPVEHGVIARLAARGLVLRRGQGDTDPDQQPDGRVARWLSCGAANAPSRHGRRRGSDRERRRARDSRSAGVAVT
jgi:hypothetical protein